MLICWLSQYRNIAVVKSYSEQEQLIKKSLNLISCFLITMVFEFESDFPDGCVVH